MSVIYASDLKTTRMHAVNDRIGNGAHLVLQKSDGTPLATIALEYPAGTVASGVLTFSGVPLTEASADATGVAAKAQLKDSAGVVVIDGLTVSSSSGDIILSSTNIVAGQPVTLSSATITHG